MMSLPLVFALLRLAHGGITVLKAINLGEVEKPAKMADGQSNVWNPLKEKPVWNTLWNSSWVRNTVNQTEADATYAWKVAENNPVLRPVVQEVENTYSQLTNVASQNATVPFEHVETHGWNVGALLCAAILLLCPAGCCGLCALFNYIHFSKTRKTEYELFLDRKKEYEQLEESSEATSDTQANVSAMPHPNLNCCYPSVSKFWSFDNRELDEVLRQEVLLMLMMKGFDREWTRSTWLAFALWGPLDHLDWFTDGSAPVQALACDLNGFQITDRWASAWDGSSAGWFVPVVQMFHVSGLVFLVFCLSAAAQQFLTAFTSHFRDASSDAVRADLCAMHGLAELCGSTSIDPHEAQRNKHIFVGVCKVALENIPQLLLQTSFLALVFDELTPLGRAKMLFSILLGLASASQKIFEAIRELVRDTCRNPPRDCGGWCFAFAFSAPFMLALVAVLWTVAKLYFIFHCDTHMWNLGSGCVEWT